MINIFVGTMYSGENELSRSIESLLRQKEIAVTHRFVTGKRELEAHKELYSMWNSEKDAYDAFLQLDPDTIIREDTAVAKMYEILISESARGYTSIQCPLYDFLTMQEIYGLNMYLPSVIFNVPQDEVFCDRSTSNNHTIPFALLPSELKPIGDHSPDPHFMQAFHFGLHRGLKNRTQQHIDVINAFRKSRDDRHAMASMGFNASRGFAKNKRTSYSDDEFMNAYVTACRTLSSHKDELLSIS